MEEESLNPDDGKIEKHTPWGTTYMEDCLEASHEEMSYMADDDDIEYTITIFWLIMIRQHSVFLSGTGISVESGLSTFRGKDRMWTYEEWAYLANIDTLYNDTQSCLDFHKTTFTRLVNPILFVISELFRIFAGNNINV